MPWKTFLKAHWGAIAAADFFSVEVLTRLRSEGWSRLEMADLFGVSPSTILRNLRRAHLEGLTP